MKKVAPSKMENGALLQEYAGLERWFGDDFSVYPVPQSAYRRADKLKVEILLRMSASDTEIPFGGAGIDGMTFEKDPA